MRALILAAAAFLSISAAPPAPYDIVIRGGRVLDGAGNPWVLADVAIREGRIARVGRVDGRGAREIDARGRYVAPGFVDMLDQSGRALLADGAAEVKLRQGVTTLIAGEGGTPVDAAEIPAYFAQLERQGIAVNFATYYGSAQARVKVMGDGAGRPTPAQIAAMRREVATAMRAGAIGLSSALIYAPATFQSREDLTALATEVGRCGGWYGTHMRDESADLLPAIDEALAIGAGSGAKVEIYHLKGAYAPGWGKLMPQAIARIEAARARGQDVAANIYPYVAGGTALDVTAPSWVWAEGREAGLAKLRDPAVRARAKRDVARGSLPGWSNLVHAAGGWRNVRLASAQSDGYRRFHGQDLEAIGRALGRDPADAAWDILLAAQARTGALYFLMSEPDVELALRQPWVSIGSDAAAPTSGGTADPAALPHPRAYGTFPRVLAEYVKRRGVLSLPEAVRKMSGWPGQRMGLSDRGLIREGLRADVILIDLDAVRDVATWDAPTRIAPGIDTVIVNGRLTLDGGRHTGARAGAVLRHSCEANREAQG